MIIIKETQYGEVGKPLVFVLLGYVIIVLLNIIAAFYSKSPSLYFALSALIFILTTPLSATISIKAAMKRKKASPTIMYVASLLLLVGILTLSYGLYSLWIALTIRPLIRNFEFALIIPIITIVITYLLAEYLERRIPELYWRFTRTIADRVRGGVSAATTAIIGPSIAFFGLLYFDAYFSFLALIYALIEMKRSLDEIRTTKKIRKNLDSFNKRLTNVLNTIPNISKIEDLIFDPANQFLIVYSKFYVPAFLDNETIERIVDYAYVYIIENFGVVSFIRIEVNKIGVDKIKVALPLKNDNEINEDFNTDKYLIAEISPSGEVVSREIIKLENTNDKMKSVEKARELIRRKVMIVGAKKIDKKAKRELNGWFTKIVSINTNILDEALKSIIRSI